MKNSEIMKQARETLSGKWKLAIGAYFTATAILIAVNSIPDAGWMLSVILSGAVTLGITIFSLSFSRNQNPQFNQIFDGFKRFGVALQTYVIMTLFVLLWSLLLIVPGIIVGLSYSMTFYLLVDYPDLSPREAIRKSKEMMDGYKWKLFKLHLRFFGWGIICILTLGIGFLWLIPYTQISLAKFYDDIKGSRVEEMVA